MTCSASRKCKSLLWLSLEGLHPKGYDITIKFHNIFNTALQINPEHEKSGPHRNTGVQQPSKATLLVRHLDYTVLLVFI